MKMGTKWIYLVLTSTVLIVSGCTPSETEKQSQAISVPMKGNNVDVEKINAYIQAQNAKLTELNEQVASAQKTAEEAKKESEELKKLAEEKTTEANNVKEELEYYKSYVKQTTSLLPAEQIQKLIEKEWSYTATINGVSLPANGKLEIKESYFNIVFSEERVKFSVLPEADSNKAKIGKSLDASISIADQKPTVSNEDNVTSVKYAFQSLEAGKTITITIEKDLMEKLHLATNVITVTVLG